MNAELNWHEQAQILGVRVRVHLFDPAEVDSRADPVARLLPVFGAALPRREDDPGRRPTFAVGGLSARPDAVFAHGDGLICLMLGDSRLRDRDNWRALFRVDAMLRTLAAAMAVAGQRQLPTAALLRDRGALYQFDPSSAVLECLATHIGDACRHWKSAVSADQLASFCEPRLRSTPGVRDIAPQST
jgi:hypothetical protein